MKSLLLVLISFFLLILLMAACNQEPTIEGRWIFQRVENGNLSPAQSYEFLNGDLLQGESVKSFTNMSSIGKYTFMANMLEVRSKMGINMQLVALTDNEAIFDIKDSTNATGRVVYSRP
jgi:hypothetical protein